MRSSARIMVLLLSAAMIIAYFVPLWFIDLEAPQYPEGLGLKIWLNKIGGDLNIINGLNHYIGMKTIDPESIPELKWMPYLLALLIISGITVAALGKKWLFAAYVGLFMVIGVAGCIDFYLWGYEYGHNLDPRAAIKVPGMSYQPPLFGTKQLLNFYAHSYPDTGGWIILSAGILFFILLCREICFEPIKAVFIQTMNRSHRPVEMKYTYNTSLYKLGQSSNGRTPQPMAGRNLKTGNPLMAAGILFLLFSCGSRSPEIDFGTDMCSFCHMVIADPRYGSVLQTRKGKCYKFDSIECMVHYLGDNNKLDGKIRMMAVSDYTAPGKFIDAATAFYLQSPALPSPMGANITGFSSMEDAEKIYSGHEGFILKWDDVVKTLAAMR